MMFMPAFIKGYDSDCPGRATRRLQLGPAEVFAAGDQLNDLPMLSRQYAHWLAVPGNAVNSVVMRAAAKALSASCVSATALPAG